MPTLDLNALIWNSCILPQFGFIKPCISLTLFYHDPESMTICYHYDIYCPIPATVSHLSASNTFYLVTLVLLGPLFSQMSE